MTSQERAFQEFAQYAAKLKGNLITPSGPPAFVTNRTGFLSNEYVAKNSGKDPAAQ
jgi:hypothetical protein